MKKQLFTVVCILAVACASYAQVKVGNNTTTINSGSVLELEHTTKGLLMPRVSLTATGTWGLDGTSVNGMTVYNTNASITGTAAAPALSAGIGMYYWDGSKWVGMSSGSPGGSNVVSAIGGSTVTLNLQPGQKITTFLSTAGTIQASGASKTQNSTANGGATNTINATSLFETLSAANQAKMITVEGLRMDILFTDASYSRPRFYNTTGSAITCNLFINGTGGGGINSYISYIYVINSSAYSYQIDADDLLYINNGQAERLQFDMYFPAAGKRYRGSCYTVNNGAGGSGTVYFWMEVERLN